MYNCFQIGRFFFMSPIFQNVAWWWIQTQNNHTLCLSVPNQTYNLFSTLFLLRENYLFPNSNQVSIVNTQCTFVGDKSFRVLMPSNGGFFWCQKAYALLNNTHTRAPSLLSDTTELTQCSKTTKNVTFQFYWNHV